ncbi:Thymidylate kinase (fragment) [Mesorhizobium plurifarium]|uniref:Thymidylate kinase n=1 Tax=Mesorhizobium plurifarium TaxID=69974 RepID=A0A090DG84_MESPL
MPGKLFFIEGPDGVGKTTTVDLLKVALSQRFGHFEFLSFPGKAEGTLGAVVYRIHHDPGGCGIATMSELSKQALHIAAHLDAIERLIMPALQSGTHVILDRFWWSTLIYGAAAGVHQAGLRTLVEAERLVWDKFQPALAILLDRDHPIDRDDEIGSWLKLRDAYRTLGLEERAHYPVEIVSNMRTPEDAVSAILMLIERTLGR